MKNLLQLLANLLAWYYTTLFSFFGILWYGKLPKISMYHWVQHSSIYKTKDMFEDKNIQVFSEEQVPLDIKERIVNKYIDELFDNESFKANVRAINIPIFDGKEVIGSRGINSVLHEAKRKFLYN